MKKMLKEVKKEKEEADPDMDKKILAKNVLQSIFYVIYRMEKS